MNRKAKDQRLGEPEIEILAPSLSAEAVEAFVSDVRLIWTVLDGLRGRNSIPRVRTRIVLADEFVAEVERLMPAELRAHEGGAFTTTREGGVVVGKNLAQSDDGSDIVVAFDASFWVNAMEASIRAHLATIVAHELSHPLIERARHASGAMEGVTLPSVTGTEVARSMSRIAAGEYRADVLAQVVVGSFITMTIGGAEVPYRSWPVDGSYVDTLHDVLGRAIPRWPDIVDDYRNRRITLDVMFRELTAMVDQTITLLVHTQASADVAGSGLDVLSIPAIASLRALQLYLRDTFPPFLAVVRRIPALVPLDETRESERAIIHAGERMITEIWSRLGLTVQEHGNREWGLRVDEPLR